MGPGEIFSPLINLENSAIAYIITRANHSTSLSLSVLSYKLKQLVLISGSQFWLYISITRETLKNNDALHLPSDKLKQNSWGMWLRLVHSECGLWTTSISITWHISQLGLPQQNTIHCVSCTTEIYFSQSWRLESPKSRCWQIRFLGKLSSCFFTVSSHGLSLVHACAERDGSFPLLFLQRPPVLQDYDPTFRTSSNFTS